MRRSGVTKLSFSSLIIPVLALVFAVNGSSAARGATAFRITHGPTMPPQPGEGLQLAHGPTMPPQPGEGLRLTHGPTMPPDPREALQVTA